MHKLRLISGTALLLLIFYSCNSKNRGYPIEPISFTDVKVSDNFWAPRIATNRTVTIPFALQKNEETGRMDNFRKAAGKIEGSYIGRRFNDTDVYKVLEGIAYSLRTYPDPELEAKVDKIIEEIAAAQEPDGYLFAARTTDPDHPAPGSGSERWINLQGSHELYNSGHLYEAAVAYFEATGKTNFLDIAIKNADLLVNTFGPDKRKDTPGHQVVEMGLAKLYRTTAKIEYLELARFFLDQRGKPHDSEPYAEGSFAMYNADFYKQDHLPVKEQTEAWGHAVRAVYMYSGIADVASLLDDKEYQNAIDKIWNNVVSKKIYLTGGVGSRHTTEAFGEDYELPNASAYNETCAAIGNVFWNHRMFLTYGKSKYIDIMERTMYNGLASGVSLSGDRFFYQNPLESEGRYGRSPWFEVSCCPGNIVRFIPSVPGYIYAKTKDELFVNLFIDSELNTLMNNKPIKVIQESNYPWDGKVKLTIYPDKPREYTISIRIPGWARNSVIPSDLYGFETNVTNDYTVSVNGESFKPELSDGYLKITRKWNIADVVSIDLPMPLRSVISNKNLIENIGKIAIQRGPIVFCLEGIDNNNDVLNLNISDISSFAANYDNKLLNGIVVIDGEGLNNTGEKVKITAIPYALWANRGEGEMTVWIKTK